MRIALVAARARNGVIGRAGALPWRLKSELAWFREVTMGKPVVMGRLTWESLPRKPLPGRLNIVISRQPDYAAEGAVVHADLGAALQAARRHAALSDGVDEICIIGGAQIYKAALPLADRLYLTEVDAEPEGDAVFPAFDGSAWAETRREARDAGPGDEFSYTVRVLDRR